MDKDILEILLVHEIKPTQLTGGGRYRYYLECPGCGKGLVIRNKRAKKYLESEIKKEKEIERKEIKRQVEEIITFLETEYKKWKKFKD